MRFGYGLEEKHIWKSEIDKDGFDWVNFLLVLGWYSTACYELGTGRWVMLE